MDDHGPRAQLPVTPNTMYLGQALRSGKAGVPEPCGGHEGTADNSQ